VNAPSLKQVLRALPAATRPLVDAVLAAAREERQAVYLVGGPVRDLLLGLAVRDVDLVVEPREASGAIQLAERAAPAGTRVVSHGRFGTVTLSGEKGGVDLATARSETYDHPGALPTVGSGTLEEDLARRDFTVNALAIPLSTVARRRRPPVVDVLGGLDDLHAKVLRIHHPSSFSDDPTRALRAARLVPRLGFGITHDSLAALRDALRAGAFGNVSPDRLRREMDKCFSDAALGVNPAEPIRRLEAWHALAAIEPGLCLPRTAVTPLRRLGRALADPPWPTGRLRPGLAGLAVWLAPLAAGLRGRAAERFGMRGEARRRIGEFPRQRDRWLAALRRARGRGAVDAVLAGIPDEELLALHAWATPAVARRVARWAALDRRRRPPIDGQDLVDAGVSGPAVGRALTRVRTAFLDGEVKTHDEALALALEVARATRKPRPRRKG